MCVDIHTADAGRWTHATRRSELGGTSGRPVPWAPGFAVRRDWPDGSHQFLRFGLSEDDARAFIPGDARYWKRGPIRPRYSVVVMSARDFELHRSRDPCRSPDCPQEAVELASVSAADGDTR
jgi:hypothetical protein